VINPAVISPEGKPAHKNWSEYVELNHGYRCPRSGRCHYAILC
jgi:hypothetical protein